MILREFPDLDWLKSQIDQKFSNRQAWGGNKLKENGWPTVIINTSSKNAVRENICGPLSLFSNISGKSHIRVDRRQSPLNQDFFLLTNPDQHYSLVINGEKEPTETFNIHFGTHFAEGVMTSLSRTPEFLLDHPTEIQPTTLNFYNRLYPKDDTILGMIRSIDSKSQTGSMSLEEKLTNLLAYLLHQQNKISKAKQQIPALKSATREEIIKRLLTATDYIYTFYHLDLSLDELAKVSCLSKFHFLRLFKIAFQKTPHRFITEIRLEKAKELLRTRAHNIHQVAKKVGFENSSSFSRLFFTQVGLYPTQFR